MTMDSEYSGQDEIWTVGLSQDVQEKCGQPARKSVL